MAFDLATIDSLLSDIVATPKPSYKIGDKSFSWNEYYNFLLKAREQLIKYPAAAMATITIDHRIDEFGQDATDYID